MVWVVEKWLLLLIMVGLSLISLSHVLAEQDKWLDDKHDWDAHE